MKEQGKLPPTKTEPNAAEVKSHPRVILLPHVMYTLPLLLTLAALWLSYRVVSVPVFADFLIATEAELNCSLRFRREARSHARFADLYCASGVTFLRGCYH